MTKFGRYVTPAEAKAWGDANGDQRSLVDWDQAAKRVAGPCENCGAPEWVYAGTGLCFACTMGDDADPSEYVELKP